MNAESKPLRTSGMAGVLLLFTIWTAATWYFEGRIETLLRPDAVSDRVIYVVIANLLIGIGGAALVLRWLSSAGLTREDAGFGSPRRTVVMVVIGAVVGFALYVAQGAPTLNFVTLLNAYAQVFVVSAAEVLVCWAVVGSAVAANAKRHGRLTAAIAGAIVASVLFGLYHFAHSAPFNNFGMVTLLTVVGVATSVFFFLSRDVYGTIVYHNFMGTFGVTQALKAAGKLDALSSPQVPLLVTALTAILLLVGADLWLLCRKPR